MPYNTINYILGSDIVSEYINKLPIVFALKVGLNTMKYYGDIPNHV
jgi:hypothetical protein